MDLLKIAARVASSSSQSRTSFHHSDDHVSQPGWVYGFYAAPLNDTQESQLFGFVDHSDSAVELAQELSQKVSDEVQRVADPFGADFFAFSGGDHADGVGRYIEIASPVDASKSVEDAVNRTLQSKFPGLVGGSWTWEEKYPYWE